MDKAAVADAVTLRARQAWISPIRRLPTASCRPGWFGLPTGWIAGIWVRNQSAAANRRVWLH